MADTYCLSSPVNTLRSSARSEILSLTCGEGRAQSKRAVVRRVDIKLSTGEAHHERKSVSGAGHQGVLPRLQIRGHSRHFTVPKLSDDPMHGGDT